MYKNFKVSEQEKKQILEMHGKYGYRKPLNEFEEPMNPDEKPPIGPQSITIKLTDKFIEDKKLYKSNREIKMEPEYKYNLGNVHAQAFKEVEFYFAEYRPDIGEIHVNCYIVPGTPKNPDRDWFEKLVDSDKLWPNEVKTIQRYVDEGELRKVYDFYSIFRKDEHYGTKGFEVGAQDHTGYFEIVELG
jgi:hypothetical protein